MRAADLQKRQAKMQPKDYKGALISSKIFRDQITLQQAELLTKLLKHNNFKRSLKFKRTSFLRMF